LSGVDFLFSLTFPFEGICVAQKYQSKGDATIFAYIVQDKLISNLRESSVSANGDNKALLIY